MERVLRDATSTLRLDLTDSDGQPLEPNTGVEVTVTDSAGDEITGSPFTATSDDSRPGGWQVSIPAGSATALDVYDTAWIVDGGPETRRTQFEIVERFFFELGALREFDEELADPADPSPLLLRGARDAAEDRFDRSCRPAFRRRGRRATLDGSGRQALIVPDLYVHRVVAVTIDDVALDAGELADIEHYDAGILTRPGGWPHGRKNITVFYEHGLASPPEPVTIAAMKLARSYLVRSPLPERATAQTTDAGTFRISIAGREGPTGIPDVDAILEEFASEPVFG